MKIRIVTATEVNRSFSKLLRADRPVGTKGACETRVEAIEKLKKRWADPKVTAAG